MVVDDSVAVDEIDKVVDDWEASCDVIKYQYRKIKR